MPLHKGQYLATHKLLFVPSAGSTLSRMSFRLDKSVEFIFLGALNGVPLVSVFLRFDRSTIMAGWVKQLATRIGMRGI